MSISKRLIQYINSKELDIVTFEKNARLANGYVGKEKNSMHQSSLDKISKVYPDLNLDWVVTGHGEMLFKNNIVSEPEGEYKKGIPMYTQAATAGEVEVYDDNAHDGPAFYVSIPQFRDCKFGKMIYGQSMYPTIHSGTYVFCKPVSDMAFFVPGEIYYLEVDNFAICKRLQRGRNDEEVLALSDNDERRPDGSPRYEPFNIDVKRIRHLYLVKGFFQQSQN